MCADAWANILRKTTKKLSLNLRRSSSRTARRRRRTARVPTTTPSKVCRPVELELVVLDPT